MTEYFYEEDPDVNKKSYMLMFKDLFNFLVMVLGFMIALLFILILLI